MLHLFQSWFNFISKETVYFQHSVAPELSFNEAYYEEKTLIKRNPEKCQPREIISQVIIQFFNHSTKTVIYTENLLFLPRYLHNVQAKTQPFGAPLNKRQLKVFHFTLFNPLTQSTIGPPFCFINISTSETDLINGHSLVLFAFKKSNTRTWSKIS